MPREIKKTVFIILTSDKGLAGAFNSAIIRKFEAYVRERNIDLMSDRYVFVAIGQKAKTYLERRKLNDHRAVHARRRLHARGRSDADRPISRRRI